MNISSLSIQSKKRLSELLEDLTDILKRKDSIIENASKEIERMNTINDMQSKLDAKSSEFTSIKTSIDAKELQELVEKSDKLSSEKEEINIKSRQLNNDLEELVNIENSLMDEINNILSSNSLSEENYSGLYVDSLGANIFIVDAGIPEDKDLISRENCEIINCSISLIAEIAKLYNSNINKIIIENENDNFDDLKQKVEQYKADKNNSYDKQLEMLKKSFEDENNQEETKEEIVNEITVDAPEEVKVSEIVTDLPKQEEPVQEETEELKPEESIINENILLPQEEIPVVNETSAVENKEENVVPLSSLLDEQLNQNITQPESSLLGGQLDQNITQPEVVKDEPTNNIIYVDLNDKVVPNQIARATKDKLNNKIINIFYGSFPETKIQNISKVDDSKPFNIDNFVTNKAA